MSRFAPASVAFAALLAGETNAWAQRPAPTTPPEATPTATTAPDVPVTTTTTVAAPAAPMQVTTPASVTPAPTTPEPSSTVRSSDPTKKPIPLPLKRRTGFAIDPVTDAAVLTVSLGFGALSQAVLITGEIVPQQPQDSSKLLRIDKIALHQHDKTAGPLSSVGLGVALAFAVADPLLSLAREDKHAMLSDFVLYAETLSLAFAATNLAKLTVRRPRPSAYIEQEKLDAQYGKDNAPSITNTDSGLSFFSGHTALVSSVASTATYLAFARAPKGSPRPWITLAVGTALTAFVGAERVRASAHFPTDVIAAAFAGIGIGLLVPHLHRFDESKRRSIWVGAAPQRGGGSAEISGTF